jgi:acid phosphatase (class A)
MPRHIIILISAVLLLAIWAVEDKTHFVSKGFSSLSLLLAPPSTGSKITKNGPPSQYDRQFSPVEAAPGDFQEMSPFQFAEVLGPNFNKNELPRTQALFEKVRVVLRNFMHQPVKPSEQQAPLPSGSSVQPQKSQPVATVSDKNETWGHLVAIILANEVPEKADELHGKAKSLASVRTLEVSAQQESERAGKVAASLIASFLFQETDFLSDFEESKQETRLALGYL